MRKAIFTFEVKIIVEDIDEASLEHMYIAAKDAIIIRENNDIKGQTPVFMGMKMLRKGDKVAE